MNTRALSLDMHTHTLRTLQTDYKARSEREAASREAAIKKLRKQAESEREQLQAKLDRVMAEADRLKKDAASTNQNAVRFLARPFTAYQHDCEPQLADRGCGHVVLCFPCTVIVPRLRC